MYVGMRICDHDRTDNDSEFLWAIVKCEFWKDGKEVKRGDKSDGRRDALPSTLGELCRAKRRDGKEGKL